MLFSLTKLIELGIFALKGTPPIEGVIRFTSKIVFSGYQVELSIVNKSTVNLNTVYISKQLTA